MNLCYYSYYILFLIHHFVLCQKSGDILTTIAQNEILESTTPRKDKINSADEHVKKNVMIKSSSLNSSSSSNEDRVPYFENNRKNNNNKPSYFNPDKYVCPDKDVRRPFFSIPCKNTRECMQIGNKNLLCCDNRCLKGVPAPPPEPQHSPALWGLIERSCPTETIPEIFEITQCRTDEECAPRICCPEKMPGGEIVGYCRTPEAKLDKIPVAKQFAEPLKLFMSYMQCTPPPPPILDVFPKPCNNPLDCFPNLCCQERGKKFCRPPKRSLLTLLTTVAQRIVPTEVARDFITRITS